MRNIKYSNVAMIVAFVIFLAIAPMALAGKGGKSGGGGGTGTTTGGGGGTLSVAMVRDQNGNGTPNWNDQITFNVSTTATDKPWVRLNCYQSGAWVSTSTAGFFAAYAWAPNFTLSSGGWLGGAGDCVATLYQVTSNGRSSDLSTLSFHVDA